MSSAQSVPSTPSWFGEVTVIAQYLRHLGVLSGISERVRFARRRFGHCEVIDFVVVLIGYAISGERTLEAFYERLQPFASTLMALFGRERLPARSTLSRFLAALDQAPVEALRAVFLEDLTARPLEKQEGCGTGNEFPKLVNTYKIDTLLSPLDFPETSMALTTRARFLRYPRSFLPPTTNH